MKYQIKAYNIWEFGQRKDAEGNPHQEDWTFPTPENLSDNARTFIVCDGMGGHDAGEVASSTVCAIMGDHIDSTSSDNSFSENVLNQAIEKAYLELDRRDTGAKKKMGTTMTFLKLYDEGYMIAHIGDSRVYHIRPGKSADDTKIIFETRDHSLVNDLIKLGEMTEEEAKTSRQKNVITRAMQPHQEYRSKADIFKNNDIKPGDYFYLCTDGMLENMEDQQICYYFSQEGGNDEEKIKKLIAATKENKDNHTAIIVHVTNVVSSPKQVNEAKCCCQNHANVQAPNMPAAKSSAPKNKKSSNLLAFILLPVLIAVIAGAIIFFMKDKKTEGTGDSKITEKQATPPDIPTVNKDLKQVIEKAKAKYDDVDEFKNGFAIVEKGEKEGFINTDGKEVIPCIYDDAEDFENGLARVKKNNKYGFIDKNGKEVIPCTYDDADDFENNKAKVEKDGKEFFIDTKGKKI